MPTISIAMATYNGAKYIREQLDSLANQTILPIELIVTDDNSTDKTLEIVAKFSENAPFPVYFEKNETQLGYRANFLKAASLCKGDLVAFCDQDDVWLPEKIEKCIHALFNRDVLLAYHNATVVDEKLQPTGATMDRVAAPQYLNPPQSMDPRLHGFGFTLVFRRELLGFNNLWEKSVHFYKPESRESHDDWFFFLAASLGTVAYISEPLVLYRQHANNVFGSGKFPLLGRIRKRLLQTDIKDLKNFALFSANRAYIMEMALAQTDGDLWTNAAMACEKYRRLEYACQLRLHMYASRSFVGRINIFLSLLLAGMYRSKARWGFGLYGMLRDIVRGLLFKPIISA